MPNTASKNRLMALYRSHRVQIDQSTIINYEICVFDELTSRFQVLLRGESWGQSVRERNNEIRAVGGDRGNAGSTIASGICHEFYPQYNG